MSCKGCQYDKLAWNAFLAPCEHYGCLKVIEAPKPLERSANSTECHTAPSLALMVLTEGDVDFVYNGIFALHKMRYYLYEAYDGSLILEDDRYCKCFVWDHLASQFAGAMLACLREVRTAYLRRAK